MAKLYDLVKTLLTNHAQLRDSDKKLMWSVWYKLGYIENGVLTKDAWMNKGCPTPESITRCRRKLQETEKELQASASVQRVRRERQKEKGTHIYRQDAQNQDIAKGHFEKRDTGETVWVID